MLVLRRGRRRHRYDLRDGGRNHRRCGRAGRHSRRLAGGARAAAAVNGQRGGTYSMCSKYDAWMRGLATTEIAIAFVLMEMGVVFELAPSNKQFAEPLVETKIATRIAGREGIE